ncbi:S1/P1 nuclease [Geopyxis carbonaria]|nr:S1/P1 nuclease [Geopyxis carbonaria]
MHLTTLLAPLVLAAPVYSWGQLGHRTTALLASRFLHPDAARSIRQILSHSGSSLVYASTWADYYSHTPHGRFSAPWHWIDAQDSPPSACGLSFARDCPAAHGCIVSALTNHTERAVDESLDAGEREMSLKWVVHFVGDIHQPLHTEDLARGGNGIRVKWEGGHSNLHHVWDSGIAEKLRGGGKRVSDAVSWADDLYEALLAGRYANVTDGWSSCLDTKRTQECALEWADQTNRWMCDYVLPLGWPGVWEGDGSGEGVELSGEYYEGAKDIVETAVATAGWRMAGWLNAMFAPDAGEAREVMKGMLEEYRNTRSGVDVEL